jgi:MSHA biogenesis protein MshL
VRESLLPDVSPPSPAKKTQNTAERRFDVSVMQADAREFFMGLVADSDYNVIVHPGVQGKLTIDLKNVSLPEVMEAVREVYGYDYKKTPAGYVIYPAEMMSRLFHVDYINLVRDGRSETRVSAGQSSQLNRATTVQSGIGGISTGGTFGSTPNSGLGGAGAMGYLGGGNQGQSGDDDAAYDCRNQRQEGGTGGNLQQTGQYGRGSLPYLPGSVIATVSNAHFWRELKQALSMIVCTAEGANFVVNQQSGVVVVRAFPKQLRDVEQFLESVRKEVQRQVVLEAKILEVVLKDGYQAGINWASLARTGGQAALASTGAPLLTALNSQSLGKVLTLGVNMGDFSAFVELLESQGEVHTLSSPRVATLNNQKAVIKVGSDEFFVTNISNTTIAGGTTITVTPNIELTPFFSGIALDVTPQIDGDGQVTLHIHPSVTEVKDQVKRLTIGDSTQEFPLAFSSVRESDSVVHARDGQIVVIGGLMQNLEQTNREGVAWLDRLPLLGGLFRRGTGDFRKSELVILLKPIITKQPEDQDRLRQEAAGRIQQLEDESRQDTLP